MAAKNQQKPEVRHAVLVDAIHRQVAPMRVFVRYMFLVLAVNYETYPRIFQNKQKESILGQITTIQFKAKISDCDETFFCINKVFSVRRLFV